MSPARLLVSVIAFASFAAGCSRVGCGKSGGGVSTGVQEVALGSGQACVRMLDASVLCWGSNALGQVGVKSKSGSAFHSTPQLVRGVHARHLLLMGVRSCFEPPEGGLTCWGDTRLDDIDAHLEPVTEWPRGKLVESQSTACAITEDGQAVCVGADESGRLSPGATVASAPFDRGLRPRKLDIGAPVSTVAIGAHHGCALRRDKRVSCWGLNNFGQLGVESYPVERRSVATLVDGIEDVTALLSGHFHTCALKADGTVWCWGRGDAGELGIGEGPVLIGKGEMRHQAAPTRVSLPAVSQLAAAREETCAITTKGDLWCWGNNAKGQLGDGTTVTAFEPVQVVSLEDVAQVAIGDSMACALTKRTELYCWGENRDGRLGNGDTITSWHPVKVKLPTPATR